MRKLTPILCVEAIEPCLDFWVGRLGFAKIVEVPDGDRLGFVMLARDDVQVMYQSRASLESDVPALIPEALGCSTVLYIDVDDLDEIERSLEGVEVIVPRRTTFYGAAELFVREPAGNVVGFAQHA